METKCNIEIILNLESQNTKRTYRLRLPDQLLTTDNIPFWHNAIIATSDDLKPEHIKKYKFMEGVCSAVFSTIEKYLRGKNEKKI